MARFDLYKAAGLAEYYLDIQADFHDRLATRVVVPVVAARKAGRWPQDLLVTLTISGKSYHAVIPMMAAVPRSELRKPLANVAAQSHEITAAIDFLLQGF
jgi:toxin CcdB